MTFLALIAIIFFGFAVYNLTCAFVDIPTKKTSQMMMLSRKQQGTKNEKLLDVYVTKIAGWIAPYLRLDRLKRNKVQRALDIAGLQLTPEVYTARAWVTAGAVGLCAIPMAFLIEACYRSGGRANRQSGQYDQQRCAEPSESYQHKIPPDPRDDYP